MSFLQDESVLEVGFTKMRMYLIRLHCTLKNDEDGTFYVHFITTMNELERGAGRAYFDNGTVSLVLLRESSKTEQAAFFTERAVSACLGLHSAEAFKGRRRLPYRNGLWMPVTLTGNDFAFTAVCLLLLFQMAERRSWLRCSAPAPGTSRRPIHGRFSVCSLTVGSIGE